MAAGKYNIQIDQGSDFNIDLTVKEDGSVKDLTGYSARAQMRSKKSDASAAATFTCTVTDASGGVIKMSLPNSTSSALTAGRYYYDLEIYTASDAIVKRLLEGEVTVDREITR
jgi:hypothetical protein